MFCVSKGAFSIFVLTFFSKAEPELDFRPGEFFISSRCSHGGHSVKKSEQRVNSEGVRERGRKFPAISLFPSSAFFSLLSTSHHSPLEQGTLLGPGLSNGEGHELVLVVPSAYPFSCSQYPLQKDDTKAPYYSKNNL